MGGTGGKERRLWDFPCDFRPWIFLFQWPQQDGKASGGGVALLDVNG